VAESCLLYEDSLRSDSCKDNVARAFLSFRVGSLADLVGDFDSRAMSLSLLKLRSMETPGMSFSGLILVAESRSST
jgi:hypothetical protein